MIEEEIRMYNSLDLMRILGIGKNKAYKLMNTKGFPSITFNRQLRVEHNALMKWLNQHQGKTVII